MRSDASKAEKVLLGNPDRYGAGTKKLLQKDCDWKSLEGIANSHLECSHHQHIKSRARTCIVSRKMGNKVDIRVGSIHSVKGETHTGTLVMETFWYGDSLEALLPWLFGG
jgi:hypothetical protein